MTVNAIKYQKREFGSSVDLGCNAQTLSFTLTLTFFPHVVHQAYIVKQADEVLQTPMGQMLMPVIMQMEGQLGGAISGGFGQASVRNLHWRPALVTDNRDLHW